MDSGLWIKTWNPKKPKLLIFSLLPISSFLIAVRCRNSMASGPPSPQLVADFSPSLPPPVRWWLWDRKLVDLLSISPFFCFSPVSLTANGPPWPMPTMATLPVTSTPWWPREGDQGSVSRWEGGSDGWRWEGYFFFVVWSLKRSLTEGLQPAPSLAGLPPCRSNAICLHRAVASS